MRFTWPFFFLLSACAYHFQGTSNPLKELGIERVYIESFTNQSFRPGIEQLFTTAMIRELEKSKLLKIEPTKKGAEAILRGEILAVDSTVGPTTQVGVRQIDVAQQYTTSVTCHISLHDRVTGKVIFSQNISDSKVYPGATQVGDAGATVPLVNESEQRLAIEFLATRMMANLYQRMVDIF